MTASQCQAACHSLGKIETPAGYSEHSESGKKGEELEELEEKAMKSNDFFKSNRISFFPISNLNRSAPNKKLILSSSL